MRLAAFRDPGGIRYGVVDGDEIRPIPDATTPPEAARLVASGAVSPGLAPRSPMRPSLRQSCRWSATCSAWAGTMSTTSPRERRCAGPAVRRRFRTARPSSRRRQEPLSGRSTPSSCMLTLPHRSIGRLSSQSSSARGAATSRKRPALDHVLGFTVANDVSARNVQREHGGQWFRGKSLDGTCPSARGSSRPTSYADPTNARSPVASTARRSSPRRLTISTSASRGLSRSCRAG